MKTKLISVITVISVILGAFGLTVSAESYVAEGNDGKQYTSIDDAIAGAGNAEVIDIKLLQDTNEWVYIVAGSSKTINIDLNGHSVKNIHNDGSKLSITDSVGNGKVESLTNTNEVNIYGGQYQLIKHEYGIETNIYDCSVNAGWIYYESDDGAINIYGGTFNNTEFCQLGDYSNINIYDGVFYQPLSSCTTKPKIYGACFRE